MRHQLVASILVMTSLWVIPALAHAQFYCSEPGPPYCIDAFGTFESEWSFNNCRDEVEAYLDDVAD